MHELTDGHDWLLSLNEGGRERGRVREGRERGRRGKREKGKVREGRKKGVRGRGGKERDFVYYVNIVQ